MIYDIWCMIYDIWYMIYDIWYNMISVLCSMTSYDSVQGRIFHRMKNWHTTHRQNSAARLKIDRKWKLGRGAGAPRTQKTPQDCIKFPEPLARVRAGEKEVRRRHELRSARVCLLPLQFFEPSSGLLLFWSQVLIWRRTNTTPFPSRKAYVWGSKKSHFGSNFFRSFSRKKLFLQVSPPRSNWKLTIFEEFFQIGVHTREKYPPQVAKNRQNRIFRQLRKFFKNTFPNPFQLILNRSTSVHSKLNEIEEKIWKFVHGDENEPT